MPADEIGRRKNCVFNFSVRLCVRECLFVAKCCRSFSRVCSENGSVIHDILLFSALSRFFFGNYASATLADCSLITVPSRTDSGLFTDTSGARF